MCSSNQGLGKRWEGPGLAAGPVFALAMILRALVILIAMPAVARDNPRRLYALSACCGMLLCSSLLGAFIAVCVC